MSRLLGPLGWALVVGLGGLFIGLAIPQAQAAGPRRVCELDVPALVENSGLVVDAAGWISTNDSGDSARLFLIDPKTCAGEREIRWSESDPEDVEALAPGPRGQVWVGDIGDNDARRDSVRLSRVVLATGAVVQTRTLRYPGGPRDAEALAVDPLTGRPVLVSKSVFGGTVYEAPAAGDRLVERGEVAGMVTDAAFWGTTRLIVRSYSEAVAYSWPDLTEVGRIDLPDQEQGEGLAVTDADTMLLTSEGVDQPVWEVPIPDSWRVEPVAEPTPATSPEPANGQAAQQAPEEQAAEQQAAEQLQRDLDAERDRRAHRMLVTGIIAVVGLLLLLRSLRPR